MTDQDSKMQLGRNLFATMPKDIKQLLYRSGRTFRWLCGAVEGAVSYHPDWTGPDSKGADELEAVHREFTARYGVEPEHVEQEGARRALLADLLAYRLKWCALNRPALFRVSIGSAAGAYLD